MRKGSLVAVGVAVLLAVSAGPSAAQVKLADGNDWAKSSPAERRAYLVGVANMLVVGALYDGKKLPGQDKTFTRQGTRALQGTTLDAATATIDRWYKANPSKAIQPVIAVIWSELVQPKLAAEK